MKVTSLRAGWLVLGAFAVGAVFAPLQARADVSGLIEEQIYDSSGSLAGDLVLRGDTGTGTDLAGMSFSYDGFKLKNITSLTWDITEPSLDFVSLDLEAVLGNPDCGGGMHCHKTTLSLTAGPDASGTTSGTAEEDEVMCFGRNCSLRGDSSPVTFVGSFNITVTPTPEPSTLVLTASALLGLGVIRRYRRG